MGKAALTQYIKTNLWQNIYIICLFLILIMNFIFIVLLDFMRNENKEDSHVSSSEYVAITSLVLLEWSLIIIQCKVLFKYIFLTDLKPILCLYCSKIVAFSDIYLLLLKIYPTEFHHPDNVLTASASYKALIFSFLNYSASLQTLTGISAVNPRKALSEFLSAVQVICFGIGYSVFIISIAVLRFAQSDIMPSNSQSIDMNDLYLSPFTTPSRARNINHKLMPILNTNTSFIKWYFRFMMLVFICIQIPRLLLMYFMCGLQCSNNGILFIGIALDCILLLLCIICGAMRMRLIKRLSTIRLNISISGLITSYITILLQFGILYFDIWLLTKPQNRTSAFNVIVYDDNVDNYMDMIAHFLYFSTTTFTNVGAETTITTHQPIGQILNSVQMVLGVIFHCVVFGVCLLDITSRRIVDTQRFVQSLDGFTPYQRAQRTKSLRDLGFIQKQLKQIVVVHSTSASDRLSHGNRGYMNPVITPVKNAVITRPPIHHDIDSIHSKS